MRIMLRLHLGDMEDVKTSLNCHFINPDVTRLHATLRLSWTFP